MINVLGVFDVPDHLWAEWWKTHSHGDWPWHQTIHFICTIGFDIYLASYCSNTVSLFKHRFKIAIRKRLPVSYWWWKSAVEKLCGITSWCPSLLIHLISGAWATHWAITIIACPAQSWWQITGPWDAVHLLQALSGTAKNPPFGTARHPPSGTAAGLGIPLPWLPLLSHCLN